MPGIDSRSGFGIRFRFWFGRKFPACIADVFAVAHADRFVTAVIAYKSFAVFEWPDPNIAAHYSRCRFFDAVEYIISE